MIDLIQYNKSLFLLFLVVCGNYIGELLGCKTQKILSENIFMKHIVLLCLIFFTINLVDDKKLHPIEAGKKTLLLWTFYLVLTKMDVYFTFIVLLLFVVPFYVELNYPKKMCKKMVMLLFTEKKNSIISLKNQNKITV